MNERNYCIVLRSLEEKIGRREKFAKSNFCIEPLFDKSGHPPNKSRGNGAKVKFYLSQIIQFRSGNCIYRTWMERHVSLLDLKVI
jgi:hypothetical protein